MHIFLFPDNYFTICKYFAYYTIIRFVSQIFNYYLICIDTINENFNYFPIFGSLNFIYNLITIHILVSGEC